MNGWNIHTMAMLFGFIAGVCALVLVGDWAWGNFPDLTRSTECRREIDEAAARCARIEAELAACKGDQGLSDALVKSALSRALDQPGSDAEKLARIREWFGL